MFEKYLNEKHQEVEKGVKLTAKLREEKDKLSEQVIALQRKILEIQSEEFRVSDAMESAEMHKEFIDQLKVFVGQQQTQEDSDLKKRQETEKS